MRDLTDQEMEVLEVTRNLVIAFVKLPELHVDDKPEFVRAVHAIQNIVMSRPVMDRFIQLDREGEIDGE